MTGICEKCTNDVVGEIIKCGGFCSSGVCLRCSGMKPEIHDALKSSGHLIWMGYACKNIMSKARFSNALVSVNAANEHIIDSLKTEIKDAILADILTEIRTNFKALIDSVPAAPVLTPRVCQSAPRSRAKRLRDTDNDEDSTSHRPAKLLCGTANCNSGPNIVAPGAIASDEPKFWLNLSGIDPQVPDDTVLQLVRTRLDSEEVKADKLVPRGREVRTLSFVSFKVSMPVRLKAKAMTADTWPLGIRFREFEDTGRAAQNFWRPPHTPIPPLITVETPLTSK
ncbi:uncharacterized protein LOC131694974 [Topomyia yanbarensis]|uniref:uncharacterized protein LOC131694974 n=1 Tax=Topomyia yanbarensis TaxID=2498891 RepID=UPI00273C6791|nr:uncharacterized protein LOC131694974 [Topomyia yanbarensis]